MTGRNNLDQFRRGETGRQDEPFEDPLVELARIVSGNDDYYRDQLRREAEDTGPDAGAAADPAPAGRHWPGFEGYAGSDEGYRDDHAAEADRWAATGTERWSGTEAPGAGGADYREEPGTGVEPGYGDDSADVEYRAEPGIYGADEPTAPAGYRDIQLDEAALLDDRYDDVVYDGDEIGDPAHYPAAGYGAEAYGDAPYADEGEAGDYAEDAVAPGEQHYEDEGWPDPHGAAGHGADHDLGEPQPAYSGELGPLAADEAPAEPARRSFGLGLKAMAAMLALIVLGGGGLFAYRNMSGGVSGPPPVIKADTRPFKVIPAAATASTSTTPGSGVYDRLSGGGGDKSEERIVVGKEAPVNVGRGDGEAASPAVSSLPKPVKTIVVKPDGTFVAGKTEKPADDGTRARNVQTAMAGGDSDAAGATAATGETPVKSTARVVTTTPVRSAARTQPADSMPANGAITDETPATPTAAAPPAPAATTPPPATEPAASTAAGVPVRALPRVKPAVPAPSRQVAGLAAQPAGQAAPRASGPLDVRPDAQSAPTVTASRQPAATASGSGYMVQVSSQRSQALAEQAYADLKRRFPGVLGAHDATVLRADLGDRGTFYRVRLGPFPRGDANQLCSQLKAAGGDCFIKRN